MNMAIRGPVALTIEGAIQLAAANTVYTMQRL